MPKQFTRRSLTLTPAQWAELDRLAVKTNSLAPSGPGAGKPSWRSLIKRIADHDITIT